jgi:signal transduction histidine kinase
VKIRGNDELAHLSRAFNKMAESIENGVQQLHLAEQQRGELIANISHDLRSPLTSIRGYLETILLKGEKITEDERREFIEISLKNVSGFQKLVEELFDLAKLEARQVEPRRVSFSVAELTQDVVLKLKPQADKMNINVNYNPASELYTFLGDIGLIERVLTNILDNAISHTPEGGDIIIQLESVDNTLKLTVVDNGPGIKDEDLPHIFERFYRADKSRNRDRQGTGLGLAIAREIVELHKGTIEAESPVTGGAVFRIILPA